MPRQRSAGRAPARPSVPSRAPSNPTHQQQTRPASYAAAPPAAAAHPPATAQAPSMGGGMLGNIASTAAGVAIGSTIGHAVSGLFGGSSSSEPLPADAAQNNVQANSQNANSQSWGNNCAGATQQFTKCMDEQGGNMQICGWYLEQLKACQAAASQY
ncbi:hypothetical protein BR93DRAFT_926957 [Coniochaeta sp. PMI_546]|nr:hypothetical protein BR93DRAFT_926957 [Coniochaeta sp. PMI_546]